MATTKQVNYIHMLRKGTQWGGDWMCSAWKGLGATMRERSGKVHDFLTGLDVGRASGIIDKLKRLTGK